MDGNGFTNKEILVRLEEKVDKILEDHELRIRTLEENDARSIGFSKGKSALIGVVLAGTATLSSIFGSLVTFFFLYHG